MMMTGFNEPDCLPWRFFLSPKIFIKWFTRISNLMLIVKYNYHDFFFVGNFCLLLNEFSFFLVFFFSRLFPRFISGSIRSKCFFPYMFYFRIFFLSLFLCSFLLITVIFSMWFSEEHQAMIMIMNASHMHIMLSNRFRRKMKRQMNWLDIVWCSVDISSQLSEVMSVFLFFLRFFFSLLWFK